MTTEEMQGIGKNIARQNPLVFRNYTTKPKSEREENKQKNPSVYILNQCQEIGHSIEESQRGGKLEISQEFFRMNDNTLIKLAFPMMKGVKNCANL